VSSEAFVLDASVTAAWLLPDEHTEAARRAYARLRSRMIGAHAPELWLWECGNIVVNAVRRGRATVEDGMLLWSVLDAVRTRVELAVLEPGQVRACLAPALEHKLSLYDAAYLWLAASLRLPLLSHDQALVRAAVSQGLEVIRMDDL
jgi:predicted nucleic acid-binding protein